ncbi:electron transfer flavoprotein [Phormidesmis priestleyi ULC007]|uniref:Electron transfer flavoprotein n=1 Tax=Phormidesmis priestleyi ULC007 TaxID=1920490 RepID=A0A2T1D5B3_9CYAN|nr:DM13 domain-containing protein [Phormidesmis priestleyi]PSB15693.1 electron transfer flavoprotein [Phormidesmis priestleyi ULC007]PZO45957.1 MAG: electron transfer flavoprotein [Phormidesmis priestleyi]
MIKHWVTASLMALVIVGCSNASNQAAESISSSPNSTPAQSASQPGRAATIVRAGTLKAGEHDTQGMVQIVTQAGHTFLKLDQSFKTSNQGPDLVVILHRSPNILGSAKPPSYSLKAGDYVVLAPLQKFSGGQQYAIPDSINVANYQSAAIWCRKFNATFGAAKLSS